MTSRRFQSDVPSPVPGARSVIIRAKRTAEVYDIDVGDGLPQQAHHLGTGEYAAGEHVHAYWSAAGRIWILPSRDAATSGTASVFGDGKWSYDFAVDGGAIGTIALRPGSGNAVDEIPAGATIVDVTIVNRTALQNATFPLDYTLAGLFIESSTPGPGGDVAAQSTVDTWAPGIATVGGGYWNTTGFTFNGYSDASASAYIVTTVARTPSLIISDFALVQGKFDVYVRWVL